MKVEAKYLRHVTGQYSVAKVSYRPSVIGVYLDGVLMFTVTGRWVKDVAADRYVNVPLTVERSRWALIEWAKDEAVRRMTPAI